MGKHTLEPWSLIGTYQPVIHGHRHTAWAIGSVIGVGCCIVILPDESDTESNRAERRATADRIVACVNALAGLNPEAVGEVVRLAQLIADEAEELGMADATVKVADAIDWEWIVDLRLSLAKLREVTP